MLSRQRPLPPRPSTHRRNMQPPFFHLVRTAPTTEPINKYFLVNNNKHPKYRINWPAMNKNENVSSMEQLVSTTNLALLSSQTRITNAPLFSPTGTLRLSESESVTSNSTTNPAPSTSAKSQSQSATPLDVLSSDYADMTLGSSIRNTGPMLSPKENIKKLKSSFFGCSTIDENAMDYVNCKSPSIGAGATVGVRKDSMKNTKPSDTTGDYAIMNPSTSSSRRIVAQIPPLNAQSTAVLPMSTKKSVLVTSNNNPDKVLANAQTKTHSDGFKPITPHGDNDVLMQHISKSSASLTAFSRQHSAPTEKPRKASGDNGGYELLELRGSSSSNSVGPSNRIVRPNSVNSEKTTFTPLMRPNSANSERQTTSTYTLSAGTFGGQVQCASGNDSLTSSSSTLCGSGTITRPQSSTFLSSGSEYSQTSRPSSVVSVIEQPQPPQQSQPEPQLPSASCNASTPTTTVITSRPPSVSSERELHYASLDLPPCSSSHAATVANNMTGNLPTGAASIQAPIAGAEAPSFTYAQIDFVKSTEHNKPIQK